MRTQTLATIAAFVLLATAVSAQEARFRRGDANGDTIVDLSDATTTLVWLFQESAELACHDAADADDNGRLEITDAIVVLQDLFTGEAAIAPPAGACGADPSEDLLACTEYASCPVEIPCLSEALLKERLGPVPGVDFCLPAGFVNVEQGQLKVAVCPEDKAPVCGGADAKGCPISIQTITPFVDFATKTVGARLEGRVDDLPISVTESIFNTTTTCTTDFRGKAAADPFSLEIALPLITELAADGALLVTGVGPGEVRNIVMVLDATGGIVCTLFAAGQAAIIPLLLAPLEQALATVGDQIGAQVVGLKLCPEPATP